METPKNFLQLIYKFVIFLRPLKGCKTAITGNCADRVCAENNDEDHFTLALNGKD
jgi:hypothetical protein